MPAGSVYALRDEGGSYRFDTKYPDGSEQERLLLKGVRWMQVDEEKVSSPGKIAVLEVGSDGVPKSFERKYPWLED